MDTLQRKISDFELKENIRKLQAYNEQGKKGRLNMRLHHQPHSTHRSRSHIADEIHEYVEKKKSEVVTKIPESPEEKERQNELKVQELKERLESKKEEVLVLREKLRSFDYQLSAKDRKIEKYAHILETFNLILIK